MASVRGEPRRHSVAHRSAPGSLRLDFEIRLRVPLLRGERKAQVATVLSVCGEIGGTASDVGDVDPTHLRPSAGDSRGCPPLQSA